MGIRTSSRVRLGESTDSTQNTGKPRTLTVVAKDGSKRVLDIEAGEFTIPTEQFLGTGELAAAPKPFTEAELTRARNYRKAEAHEFRGVKNPPTVEQIARDMRERPEEYAFLDEIEAERTLEDPHYFDSDPDDYVASGFMDGDEMAYRASHRRPKFRDFLNHLAHTFNWSIDSYDWTFDESTFPIIIDSVNVDALTELAHDAGFTTEVGDDDFDCDGGGRSKMWVYDPKVLKLIPADYNPYSIRGLRDQSRDEQ